MGQILPLGGQGVVLLQLLHTQLGEGLVPLHHLVHRPLEGPGGLLRVSDHGDQQVGDAVVGGQLHHLRVHHDEAHILGAGLVEQRDDEGVGAHGLTGAGGTGDEHVGQLGDVPHDVLVPDVPAHGKGHRGLVLGEGPGLDDIPDQHRRDGFVGHLDAHHGDLLRDGGDAHAAGPQGQGDVVGQVGDLAELHPLVQDELVAGDGGSPDHVAAGGVHAEAAEGVRQALGVGPQLRPRLDVVVLPVLVQQGDGREVVGLLHRHAAGDLGGHLGGGGLHLADGVLFPPPGLHRRLLLELRFLNGDGFRRRSGDRRRLGLLLGLGRGIAVGSTAGEHVGGGHLPLVPGLEEAGEHAALPLPGWLLVIIQGDVDLRPGRVGTGRPGRGLCGSGLLHGLEELLLVLVVLHPVVQTLSLLPHLPEGGEADLEHHHQQHQDQDAEDYHGGGLAQHRQEPLGGAPGKDAAAVELPAGGPQLAQQAVGAGEILPAEEHVPHPAEEIGHQQGRGGPQGHRPPLVGQQDPGRRRQGRGHQEVAEAKEALEHRGQQDDEPAVLVEIAEKHAQGQDQKHHPGDLPADGPLGRGFPGGGPAAGPLPAPCAAPGG